MTGRQAARWIAVTGAGVGALLGLRPQLVSRIVSGASPVGAGWVRLLGARHLGQGAVLLKWPQSRVLAGSAAVDALHAATMVALAVTSRRYRRPAAVSAAVAIASGAASVGTAARLDREGR